MNYRRTLVFTGLLFSFSLIWLGFVRPKALQFRIPIEKVAEEVRQLSGNHLESIKAEVEGSTLHYAQTGDDSKPLLFFIHGTPGSLDAFKSYLSDSLLNRHFQMISVDRPGFGASDFGTAMIDMEKQAMVLSGILDRHPDVPVYLIGHSFGGPVAARMAMDYPQRIKGVVLIASFADPALKPKEWWRAIFQYTFFRWMIPTAMAVCNDEIEPMYRYLQEMDEKWKGLNMPLLCIHGKADRIVPYEHVAYVERKAINVPGGVESRILQDSDHFLIWTQKDQMVAYLMEFINEG